MKALLKNIFSRLGAATLILSLLIFVFPYSAHAATTTTTFITAGNTWVAPPGVTSIQVEAWGGGGAGGERTSNGGGGGGAGGEYAKETNVTVTPGTTYTITVGAAGTTGAPGTNGGNSQFIGNNVTVLAHGGATVAVNTTTGAATTTGSTNAVHFDGAKGADSPSGTSGGGGGSSAGTATFGNTGSGNTGGVAPTGGGVGGNGKNSTQGDGSAPASGNGGGGGGSTRTSSATRLGGAGAIGKVILTYTTPLTQSLTDNFNDNSIDAAKWLATGPGTPTNQVLEVNNQSEISTDGVNGDYFTLQSNAFYDLTSSYSEIHIINSGPPLTNEAPNPLVLSDVAGQNKLFYSISPGTPSQLQAYKVVGGVQTQVGSNTNFDSTATQYLRIRESAGTTFWDYSADGRTWTNDESLANPITVTSLSQNIQNGQFGIQSAVTLKTDDFNIPPPAPSSGPSIFVVRGQMVVSRQTIID